MDILIKILKCCFLTNSITRQYSINQITNKNNIVGALSWAVPYGAEEISVMQHQAKEILEWYDDMNQIIPSWYLNKKKTE